MHHSTGMLLIIAILLHVSHLDAQNSSAPAEEVSAASASPELVLAMHISRLLIGAVAFVLNAVVLVVLAPPFVAIYCPMTYLKIAHWWHVCTWSSHRPTRKDSNTISNKRASIKKQRQPQPQTQTQPQLNVPIHTSAAINHSPQPQIQSQPQGITNHTVAVSNPSPANNRVSIMSTATLSAHVINVTASKEQEQEQKHACLLQQQQNSEQKHDDDTMMQSQSGDCTNENTEEGEEEEDEDEDENEDEDEDEDESYTEDEEQNHVPITTFHLDPTEANTTRDHDHIIPDTPPAPHAALIPVASSGMIKRGSRDTVPLQPISMSPLHLLQGQTQSSDHNLQPSESNSDVVIIPPGRDHAPSTVVDLPTARTRSPSDWCNAAAAATPPTPIQPNLTINVNVNVIKVRHTRRRTRMSPSTRGLPKPKRREVSAVMLLMLAQSIVDMLLPLQASVAAITHIVLSDWIGGDRGAQCQIDGWTNQFFSCISIGNLIIISRERYATVVVGKTPTVATALKLHGTAWIIALIINFIPIFGYLHPAGSYERHWIGEWVIHPNGADCWAMGRSIYIAVTFTVYVLIGFNVIFYCNFRIALHVRKIKRATESVFRTQKEARQAHRYQTRVAMVLLLLSVAFACCWSPAAASFLWFLIYDKHVALAWDCLLVNTGHLSFTLNPVVCGYIDPRVRDAFTYLGERMRFVFCCGLQCQSKPQAKTATPSHQPQSQPQQLQSSQPNPSPPLAHASPPHPPRLGISSTINDPVEELLAPTPDGDESIPTS